MAYKKIALLKGSGQDELDYTILYIVFGSQGGSGPILEPSQNNPIDVKSVLDALFSQCDILASEAEVVNSLKKMSKEKKVKIQTDRIRRLSVIEAHPSW